MKRYALLSYLWAVLFLAMFLIPAFLIFTWFDRLRTESPDVPDPSWADPIIALCAFCSNFPATPVLGNHPGTPLAAKASIAALFWGLVIASLFHLPVVFQKRLIFK